MEISFINSDIFSLVVIPILIFVAKIGDVTFGTIRIIYISRGKKYLAPIFAFFEIIIWLFAIVQIMQHLTDFIYYIAYAIGYSTGSFIGVYIEEKMAIGTVIIRIITNKDITELVEHIRSAGYGATIFDGDGSHGKVKLIYSAINRKDIDGIANIIKQFNPRAFMSIEEVRFIKDGIFPGRHHHWISFDSILLHKYRK